MGLCGVGQLSYPDTKSWNPPVPCAFTQGLMNRVSNSSPTHCLSPPVLHRLLHFPGLLACHPLPPSESPWPWLKFNFLSPPQTPESQFPMSVHVNTPNLLEDADTARRLRTTAIMFHTSPLYADEHINTHLLQSANSPLCKPHLRCLPTYKFRAFPLKFLNWKMCMGWSNLHFYRLLNQ